MYHCESNLPHFYLDATSNSHWAGSGAPTVMGLDNMTALDVTAVGVEVGEVGIGGVVQGQVAAEAAELAGRTAAAAAAGSLGAAADLDGQKGS